MCKDKANECKEHGHGDGAECHCEAHHEKFIDAAMLLLIAKDPSHGYDLIEKLSHYGYDSVDAAKVYRRLRRMEADRFLESQWIPASTGPARRAYTITQEGVDYLLTWRPIAQKTLGAYKGFIEDMDAMYPAK